MTRAQYRVGTYKIFPDLVNGDGVVIGSFSDVAGEYLFAGPETGARDSRAYQVILFEPENQGQFAAALSNGYIKAQMSAYLGGWGVQDDQASITYTFYDDQDQQVGAPVTLGPVTKADRGGGTSGEASFQFREDEMLVPANAHSVRVEIFQEVFTGPANDGYADLISL